MKLYRFMSNAECEKLMQGKELENHTDHSVKRGTASTAKGFCFGIGDKEQARKDFRRLSGIVSSDILVVADVSSEREYKFTPCQGRYIDYEKIDSEGKTIDDYPLFHNPHKMFDEYCAEKYSLNNFEKCHFYRVSRNMMKYPQDPDHLQLEKFWEEDVNKLRKKVREIKQDFERIQKRAAEKAFAALSGISSVVFVQAKKNRTTHKKEYVDPTELLKEFFGEDDKENNN